jgi:hypothetical protein
LLAFSDIVILPFCSVSVWFSSLNGAVLFSDVIVVLLIVEEFSCLLSLLDEFVGASALI